MIDYLKRLYANSASEFYETLKTGLKNKQKMFVVTANPETLMLSQTDTELKNILDDPNIVMVPDGIGVVKAAQMKHINIKERIPGIEIATKLLEYGSMLHQSIYLYGASQTVIDSLLNVIMSKYSDLRVVGAYNGYDFEDIKIKQDIIEKKPDIVLVALGIPRQEKVIQSFYASVSHGIFVGVGGSFDVISGHKKRAPKLFQTLNLEWLYRIVKEPKRWKRFYQNNIGFVKKIREEKSK